MKRRVLLAAGTAALLPQLRAQAAPALPGEAVVWPDIPLLDGSRLAASQLQGRAAVVVFWSTTCPFCRRHNQHLEKLYREVKRLGGKLPLLVLGVARDKDAGAVQRYAAQQGYSFPISMDWAPLAAALSDRKVIPLTVTVDARGQLKQVLPGEMFEEDVMELLQLPRQEPAKANKT